MPLTRKIYMLSSRTPSLKLDSSLTLFVIAVNKSVSNKPTSAHPMAVSRAGHQ